jgi:hypothetical protein
MRYRETQRRVAPVSKDAAATPISGLPKIGIKCSQVG